VNGKPHQQRRFCLPFVSRAAASKSAPFKDRRDAPPAWPTRRI